MKERKNVYKLPAGDKTLEWYAKAVIAMKQKPTTDPRSWNFQAAIHGFNANLPAWQGSAPIPSRLITQQFWNQCQHGSWYFLPWHRMYLAQFESIVAQTIVELGGPPDWALPYWNYSDTSNPQARTMPPAFTSPANAGNGLWRSGRQNTTIPARYVSLSALRVIPFTGNGQNSPLGFGGPETPFSHNGGTHGELEQLPHDVVHGIIGGVMGDPRTAALDPIFWLHHANIDRLWQVWLNQGGRLNPKQNSWLDLKFNFYSKTGKPGTMTSRDVLDTRTILGGYVYQDVPPSAAPVFESAEAAPDFSEPLEIVAASNKKLNLESAATSVTLTIVPPRKEKPRMESASDTPATTILHFENIKGKGQPPVHDVYINPPESGDKEAYYAGSLGFFGVEEASTASTHHSGSGQHLALDISELVAKLRTEGDWKGKKLNVVLEPTRKLEEGEKVTIGRISLYSA